MSPVKMDKSFFIQGVIVTPDSVRALVRIIITASKELTHFEQRYTPRISCSVVAADGMQYSSETTELFDKGGELDTKQIEYIEIAFRDYDCDAFIDVHLSQQGSKHRSGSTNAIRVRGINSTWVSGISDRLRVAVGDFKKQEAWPTSYRTLLWLVVALSFGTLFIRVIEFIFNHIIHVTMTSNSGPYFMPGFEWLSRVAYFALVVFVGSIPASLLINHLMELWPPVEFQMGHDWMQPASQRRKRLWTVGTLVVIPLIVSFAYDLLKKYSLI